MPFEVIESYGAKCQEEDKTVYDLELLFRISFLRFVCGKEPGGCSLDIIRKDENGVPMASIVLFWKGADYVLDQAATAYVILCKRTNLFFDEKFATDFWKIVKEVIEKKNILASKYIHLERATIRKTNKKRKLNSKEELIDVLEEMILEQQRNEGEQLIGSRELDRWGFDNFSSLFPGGFTAFDQAEYLVSCGDWEHAIGMLNELEEEDWGDIDLWILLEILDPSPGRL